MNLDELPIKKRMTIIALLILPLLIAIFMLFYLKISWTIVAQNGEKMSPIENKPLFVGLVIFTVGYLFFLGMLFSENIIEIFNKRFALGK